MPKLTLNADEDVIADAKELAKERGVSVSAMFRQLVQMLKAQRRQRRPLPPITKSLCGIAKAPEGKTDRELIEEAILEKYGQ